MGAIDLGRYLWPDIAEGRLPQQPTPIDRDNAFGARVIGGCVPGVFSFKGGGSKIIAPGISKLGAGSAGGSGNYAKATAATILSGRAAGFSAQTRDLTLVFAGYISNAANIWFYDGQSDGGSSWWVKTDASGNLSVSFGTSSNYFGTSVAIPTGFVVLIVHAGTFGGAKARCWVNGVATAGSSATDSWPASPAFSAVFGSSAFPTANTFAGVGNYFGVFRGNFTDTDAAALNANLAQVFDFPVNGISMAFGAGGAQSFSYSATGGMIFGGAGTELRGRQVLPVGGAMLGGSAPDARGVIESASGGMQLGGSATEVRGLVRSPSGGLTLGGVSSALRGLVKAATGGLIFGGTANEVSTQSLVYSAVGGFVLGGAATVVRAVTAVLGGGGLKLGGAAQNIQFGNIYNNVVDWLVHAARRRGRR